MHTYQVEVKETLARIVTVTTETPEDAVQEVSQAYREERLVLDSGDYVDTEIEQYPRDCDND